MSLSSMKNEFEKCWQVVRKFNRDLKIELRVQDEVRLRRFSNFKSVRVSGAHTRHCWFNIREQW